MLLPSMQHIHVLIFKYHVFYINFLHIIGLILFPAAASRMENESPPAVSPVTNTDLIRMDSPLFKLSNLPSQASGQENSGPTLMDNARRRKGPSLVSCLRGPFLSGGGCLSVLNSVN